MQRLLPEISGSPLTPFFLSYPVAEGSAGPKRSENLSRLGNLLCAPAAPRSQPPWSLTWFAGSLLPGLLLPLLPPRSVLNMTVKEMRFNENLIMTLFIR